MQEIKITKKNPPIPKDFTLSNLERLNIIVGRNNVGKTRFFEAIEKQYTGDKELEVVYIRANDVDPSDDQFKETAATSALISNVIKLFSNLNIPIEINNEKEIKNKLQFLIYKTNKNFQEFTRSNDFDLKNDVDSTNIKIEPIIQSLFNKFLVKEVGVKDELKISQIGQGYQRIFVASILKSYVDLYKKYGPKDEAHKKETLILFEEPEIFLHPELKRNINKSIKDILDTDKNITILISTHDPYFLYSNINGDNVKIFSFEKEGGETQKPIEGVVGFGNVADEMLHISLFNKVHDKMTSPKPLGGPGISQTSFQMESLLSDNNLIYKGKDRKTQISVLLPIYVRNVIHHGDISTLKNGEIEKSIKILSNILENQI